MRMPLLLLLLSSCLSGCALTTERIDITHFPQNGTTVIAGADKVVVSVVVNDQRQDKSNRVSSKKNGFGMEMAPILANEDVTLTIRRAIEQELQARGFTIGSQAVVSIGADLQRFWNDHKVGFFTCDAVADLNMSLTVQDQAGKILYTNSIYVQGIESNTLLMDGNNARLALNKALDNGMQKLFDDPRLIEALLATAGRKPS